MWRVTFALSGGKDMTPRRLKPANKSLRPRLSFARLLRGEPLGLVAWTNVSIARLTEWRERALAGEERECDDRNDEIARLKSKVGEITKDNELLYAKIAALEGKRPLAHRRPRR